MVNMAAVYADDVSETLLVDGTPTDKPEQIFVDEGEHGEDIECQLEDTIEEIVDSVIEEVIDGDEEEEASSEERLESAVSSRAVTKTTGFAFGSFLASLSINLVLPFINGLMLGFGELIAHEVGFRYNWFGANVSVPYICLLRAYLY